MRSCSARACATQKSRTAACPTCSMGCFGARARRHRLSRRAQSRHDRRLRSRMPIRPQIGRRHDRARRCRPGAQRAGSPAVSRRRFVDRRLTHRSRRTRLTSCAHPALRPSCARRLHKICPSRATLPKPWPSWSPTPRAGRCARCCPATVSPRNAMRDGAGRSAGGGRGKLDPPSSGGAGGFHRISGLAATLSPYEVARAPGKHVRAAREVSES